MWQIEQQIDWQAKDRISWQVNEQVGQICRGLFKSFFNKKYWQSENQVKNISNQIWQKTGIRTINHYDWRLEFELNGKICQIQDGYLVNFEDWNIKVAECLATGEGVKMTDAHWEIINIMREYYKERGTCLSGGMLIKNIAKRLGYEKGNLKYLYELFPGDSRHFGRQAWKIAGFPPPPHWPPGLR